MKTLKNLIIMIALSLSCLYLGPSYGDTARDNDVYFIFQGNWAANPSFALTNIVATQMDTYQGIQQWAFIANMNDPANMAPALHIQVTIGRKGSADVANYFNSNLYDGAIADEVIGAAMDNTPGDLNFCIRGGLTISGKTYDILLGQGHNSLSQNNWWIGGPDLTGFAVTKTMVTKDGRYKITLGSDDRTFIVSPQPIANNWMEQHVTVDSVPLSSVSMPGTHDSGTYAIPETQPAVNGSMTQYISIISQLNAGARVLDIRLGDSPNKNDNSLYVWHGSDQTTLSFDSVLRQATDFLAMNPKETVVMLIKHEHGSSDITARFLQALSANSPDWQRFWLQDYMPTIGDVRGKIVIVDRDGATGVGISVDWQDNGTFNSSRNVSFRIQDLYWLGCIDSAYAVLYPTLVCNQSNWQTKVNAATSLISDANSNPAYADDWIINYLSATNGKSPFIPAYLYNDVAKPINLLAEQTFGLAYAFGRQPARYGTTMVDFAGIYDQLTPNIFSMVIGANGALSSPKESRVAVSFYSEHQESEEKYSPTLMAAKVIGAGFNSADDYRTHVRIGFGEAGVNLAKLLSSASKFEFRMAGYNYETRFKNDPKGRFHDVKGGRVVVSKAGEKATFKWDDKNLDVFIKAENPADNNKNIFSPRGKRGNISGTRKFEVDLDWLHWEGTLSYKGVARTSESAVSGNRLKTWRVRGSNQE
ncbi:phosphatidylinositol-specific phospholipase C domain-containing protein [Methylolobus aquaticus]